ncbi:MAG: LicD family protein [Clostridia bacterium]|nr:LicD family protein [Clostridia bacterium]
MKEFNLEEVVDCGFTITSKRKRVWQIELEMFQELDRVCKKYHLKFFADSGTLLGTIRHQGFIPWDDDMDFVMLREDYNKLLKVAEKEFKEPFFFQTAYSDKGYYRGHAQIRNSNTTGILPYEGNNVSFHQGIFIDIFPLDFVSKNQLVETIRHKRLVRRMKLFDILLNRTPSPNKIKENVKKMIRFVYQKRDVQKMYATYEKIASHVPFKSEEVCKVSYYTNGKKYKLFPKKYFEEVEYKDFENTQLPVSKEYNKILTMYYGKDYIKPQNKSSSHGTVIYEVDEKYTEVLNKMKEGKTYENFDL